LRSVLLAACVSVATILIAQSQSDEFTLYFKTGTVVPEANAEVFLSSYKAINETLYDGQFFKIIQFADIPTEEVKQTLSEAGITLLDYLPQKAYFAAFQKHFNTDALNGTGIRSILPVAIDYKLSPRSLRRECARSRHPGERINPGIGKLLSQSRTGPGCSRFAGGRSYGHPSG
ncbi:MAG: hypothetical protein ABIK52_08995, partial [Bacteroidota bacterium]